MRETRTFGSARGAAREGRPYRDPQFTSAVILCRAFHLYYTAWAIIVLDTKQRITASI